MRRFCFCLNVLNGKLARVQPWITTETRSLAPAKHGCRFKCESNFRTYLVTGILSIVCVIFFQLDVVGPQLYSSSTNGRSTCFVTSLNSCLKVFNKNVITMSQMIKKMGWQRSFSTNTSLGCMVLSYKFNKVTLSRRIMDYIWNRIYDTIRVYFIKCQTKTSC